MRLSWANRTSGLSDRMSSSGCGRTLLLYCVCLLTCLNPAGVAEGTFGLQKRQDNVRTMTATGGSTHDGNIVKPDGNIDKPDGNIDKPDGKIDKPDGNIDKPDGNIDKPDGNIDKPDGSSYKPDDNIDKPDGNIEKPDDTGPETWTNESVMYLTSTSASAKKSSTSSKKHARNLRKKFSGHYKHTNNKSTAENKKSTKHLLQSSATNPPDMANTFKKNPDKPQDFYRVTFKDKFRCLPCQCYSTMSGSIVASCNASIGEINAVLRNDTGQLTISNSKLTVFQASDFFQYHNLQNLTVSNNVALYTVANSSHNIVLMNVSSLDLSSNNITDIEDNSFKAFPNLLHLSMANNSIVIISTLTFEGLGNLYFLNLSQNNIVSLNNGTLGHFAQLKVLDVSWNGYNMSFMPGVFSSLVNLEQLFLNGNLRNATSYPNKEIARLTNLTSLSIESISHDIILGPEIKTLGKLVILNVGILPRRACHLTNITESFLTNVPHLQTIRFFKCRLKNVDVNVYRNVSSLMELGFFYTYPYDIFQALGGLQGLQNSSLKSLSLVGLIPNGCPFICLYGVHAKYLRSTTLEVIDLSYNRVGYMDMKFLQSLPQTLKRLIVCGNELIEPMLLTDKLLFLNNLELIDLGTYSDPSPSGGLAQTQTSSGLVERHDDATDWDAAYIVEPLEDLKSSATEDMYNEGFMKEKNSSQTPPLCRDHFSNDHINGIIGDANSSDESCLVDPFRHSETATTKAPMLKYLRAPGFLELNMKDLFKSIVEHQYTHLTYLDLSYCALPSLTDTSYIPSWIQAVNYNGNYFRQMHHKMFRYNNSLTYFSLNNNALGYIFANTKEMIFKRLNNLVYLDISSNMIYDLPTKFFRGLENLKSLILGNNKLGLLDVNFSTTPKLEYLDLSENSINWISKSTRDDLDIIGTSHTLYIDLTSNPLRCTCEGLEMLHWIWASNIHFVSEDMLKCILDDGSVEDLGTIDDRVRTLQRQCAGKGLIIVLCVASLAVMCFLVVFGVMYRYRWQLRYIRNIALSRFIGYKPRETARTEYKFDAFIVYSDMSRQFVVGDCLQELEVKRGHKLCVDGRDFMPGTYEVSAIVSAIQSSRKTVLILSPDFYDEQFSEYCVKMALMEEIYKKRSVLYLCVYRPLPGDDMSKSYDLLMIMKRNTYLEFPPETETSDEVRQNFWDELSEKIGHSVTEELPDPVVSTES